MVKGLEAGEAIADMSNEDYHAHPNYSSSQIKYAYRNIEHFKRAVIDKEVHKEASTAFRIGTLFHEMILEADKFDPFLYPASKIDRRTKVFKDFSKENPEANNNNTVTEGELRSLRIMRRNLLEHADCPDFESTENEMSLFYDHNGLGLRTRPDGTCHKTKTIFDLKTTSKPVGKWDFGNQVKYFDYDLSAAMYLHNMLARMGEAYTFTWVVVQTVEPYSAAIYHVGKNLIDRGWEKYQQGIFNIINSQETGKYVFQERAETLDI